MGLGTIAGILPDVDSDHSVPTRIVFRLLAFVAAMLTIVVFQAQIHFLLLLVLALGSALAVRYLLYPLFASITVHRGLFHSLPAAILLGLAMVCVGLYGLQWSVDFAWLAASFVSGGYILHLLLDEFYSVDFMGRSLKSSFGSALTVFNRSSWLSYSFLYLLVTAGFYSLPLPAILQMMI